jgi:hypothetical protein
MHKSEGEARPTTCHEGRNMDYSNSTILILMSSTNWVSVQHKAPAILKSRKFAYTYCVLVWQVPEPLRPGAENLASYSY